MNNKIALSLTFFTMFFANIKITFGMSGKSSISGMSPNYEPSNSFSPQEVESFLNYIENQSETYPPSNSLEEERHSLFGDQHPLSPLPSERIQSIICKDTTASEMTYEEYLLKLALIFFDMTYENNPNFSVNIDQILDSLTNPTFEDSSFILSLPVQRTSKIPGKYIFKPATMYQYPTLSAILSEARKNEKISMVTFSPTIEIVPLKVYHYKNRGYSILDLVAIIIRYNQHYLTTKNKTWDMEEVLEQSTQPL